jgi:hypothetical protein
MKTLLTNRQLTQLTAELQLLDLLVVEDMKYDLVDTFSYHRAFDAAVYAINSYGLTCVTAQIGNHWFGKFIVGTHLSPTFDGTSLDDLAEWLSWQETKEYPTGLAE